MLFICSALSFLSCSNDDSSDSVDGIVTAKINGQTWRSTTLESATLLQVGNEGQRFDIIANNDQYRFTLSIEQADIDDCMINTSYEIPNGIFLFYIREGNFDYPLTIDVFNETVQNNLLINITGCSNGKMTGTFSGTLYRETYDDTIDDYVVENFEITEGSFTNIPFTTTTINP